MTEIKYKNRKFSFPKIQQSANSIYRSPQGAFTAFHVSLQITSIHKIQQYGTGMP